MWPHASFTGRFTVSSNFHTLLSKGSWQMTQNRSSQGMFVILTLEAERRKSNWAVIFFNSQIVFGEIDIVYICLLSTRKEWSSQALESPWRDEVLGLCWFKSLLSVRIDVGGGTLSHV